MMTKLIINLNVTITIISSNTEKGYYLKMSSLFRIFVYADDSENETKMNIPQIAAISFVCFMVVSILMCYLAKKPGDTQANSSDTNDARSSFENPLRKFILCKVDSDFD